MKLITLFPKSMPDRDADGFVLDALARYGPLCQRHIRASDNPLTIGDTAESVQRLKAQGRIVEAADGTLHLAD